ncbi:hypothetical protein HCQ94_02105 [Actinomyces sp. zg-332]|uniref:hypothetical protein n=1 Tax=Actinomyces sp. zg-332 TaxID=2708340 RepID=UPI00142110F6|nr:hypothetical protein [Actinomyces sp. zg-332]QPK94518.1 hypothetical protein HCQ94_02105 [Actinomyces sp. zg-332]
MNTIKKFSFVLVIFVFTFFTVLPSKAYDINVSNIRVGKSSISEIDNAIKKYLRFDTTNNYSYFDTSLAVKDKASADLINIGESINTIYENQLQKRHDDCYAKRGYWKCSCDQNLINEINRDLRRTSRIVVHVYAIKAWFTAKKLDVKDNPANSRETI